MVTEVEPVVCNLENNEYQDYSLVEVDATGGAIPTSDSNYVAPTLSSGDESIALVMPSPDDPNLVRVTAVSNGQTAAIATIHTADGYPDVVASLPVNVGPSEAVGGTFSAAGMPAKQ